jgi:hypothetical protein
MDQNSDISPTQEALREQLKELNNRSRWYSGQLWYIPFAYFGRPLLSETSDLRNLNSLDLRCCIVGLLESSSFGTC